MLDYLRSLKSRLVSLRQGFGYTRAWTSPAEQSWLRSYAHRVYTGEGEIVDLGCLLGGTTIAMARGLKHNRKRINTHYRIHSFDRFIYDDWMADFPGRPSGHFSIGDSFYGEFLARITKFHRLVAPYPVDLTTYRWHGQPIELLVSDASKSLSLCIKIVNSFYPSLLPDSSFLFEQDFLHWYTPWIHLVNFRLRDVLKPKGLISNSTTFLFQPCKPIDASMLTLLSDLKAACDAEISDAFSYSASLIQEGKGWQQAALLAAKAMHFCHNGDLDKAFEIIQSAKGAGYSFASDLAQAKAHIELLMT